MTTDSSAKADGHSLEIALDHSHLRVSSLSSLLRVVQAALREVARSNDETRQEFSQQPQPVLVLSTQVTERELSLRFLFADPVDSTPMLRLSSQTFSAFVEQFGQLLKGLPQRGLWGESIGGAQSRRYETEAARRLDQVRLELRRFPRARLSYNRHTIKFEGDRMEIG